MELTLLAAVYILPKWWNFAISYKLFITKRLGVAKFVGEVSMQIMLK